MLVLVYSRIRRDDMQPRWRSRSTRLLEVQDLTRNIQGYTEKARDVAKLGAGGCML
jgi:hypothetical protein